MTQTPRAYYVLLAIFVASGFAGLVYESVWAQYLKLFLGHAAYAQTLVLCIFMGGLAIGAGLAARYSRRISHPLLAYAAIEAVIGLLGLLFHGIFTRAMDFHYHHLLPLTSDPVTVTAMKGLIALLLIGPQTVLLGATFPLMTAGVLRALPQASGHKISMLYFSNSIGAAAGVLASVFVFIPWSGLPGTMLSAGLINVAVALGVWLIVRRGGLQAAPVDSAEAVSAPEATIAPPRRKLAPWLILAAAAVTGMASFVYEVVWIRMLSLVLGSSTHSFELMLSAFITGLALGSLALRRAVDRIAQPYRVLGYIQILMGLFALGSLWVYSESFHWMVALLQGLSRTDQGYTLFLFASHAICFAIMLPATFMAGMTLPLITYALLRDGYGERAVGTVYSVNTLGSIAGVLLALHVLMPLAGLKSALIIGGGLDILLGVLLLALTAAVALSRRVPALAAVAGVVGTIAAALGVTLDPSTLSSGVYRFGRAALPKEMKMLFYEDGKTASISLYQGLDGGRVLATNGKPEGRIDAFKDAPIAGGDDLTTTLLGGMGMAFHPEARSVANIGLGTGVTTRTLLRNPRLERVDTIEIEQKVVDAVQLLRDEVDVIFTDRRSRIILDDAKSFFAASRARYDIIVAEPSNPWVSGVASLFTAEFYRRMLDHLTERGVLVQWFQVYEIDLESIASVMLALGRSFPNYTIYTTNGTDILVVAWKSDEAREPDPAVLAWPGLRADWQRVGVEGIADIEVRRIGSKKVLHPFFRSYTVPENSDYFPYLDHRAARARFLKQNAEGLNTLRTSTLPLVEMLEGRVPPYQKTNVAKRAYVHRAIATRDALATARYLAGERELDGLVSATRTELAILSHYCGGGPLFPDAEGLTALVGVAVSIVPYLTPEEARKALAPTLQDKCVGRLGDIGRLTGALLERIIERDAAGMRSSAEQLLARLPKDADRRLLAFALDSAMVGAIVNGDPAHAHRLWRRYGKQVQTGKWIPVENRLMLAVAEVRKGRR